MWGNFLLHLPLTYLLGACPTHHFHKPPGQQPEATSTPPSQIPVLFTGVIFEDFYSAEYSTLILISN